MKRSLRHGAEALGLAVTGAVAARTVVFPRLHTWGATPAEVGERLPGDDLVADPAAQTTRAVTVAAPAAEVWRWLVQIGTDRGGWYTYDRLERLAGVPVHNTDEIREEWQHLAVGDRVVLAPPGWLGVPGGMALPVAELRAGEAIVLRQAPPDSPWDGVWSFHVRSTGEGSSRLLARSRTHLVPGPVPWLASLFIDPVTFTMETGMLRGIRERAERAALAAS